LEWPRMTANQKIEWINKNVREDVTDYKQMDKEQQEKEAEAHKRELGRIITTQALLGVQNKI
jgi:hypothetical protein